MLFRRKAEEKQAVITVGMLNDLLDQRLRGEAIDLSDNGELEVFFRKVEDAISDGHQMNHKVHKEVNQLTQYIMKMDFVRDMMVSLNTQLSSVEMVTATSEEMSKSILEIAGVVADNTASAGKSLEVTENGTLELRDAVGKIDDAYKRTGQAKDRVSDVTEQASKINEMVGIIESVADQTNLLALNASIEAARAGDAGRGFAVVADEIRKLAESTRDSVKLIQEVVNDLNQTVDSSVEAIEEATVSFREGIDYINKASGSVDLSRKEMDTILNGMEAVSQQIEEQTASTQEVAANVQDINEHTKRLYAIANQTANAFSDVGSEVNGIRKELIESDILKSETDVLDIAITDHLSWRWNVSNAILGYKEIKPELVGNHHECRLGIWADQAGQYNPAFKNQLARLEEPHARLHKEAYEAAVAISNGDKANAEKHLERIEADSELIVGVLSEMMAQTLEGRDTKKSAALFEWSQKLTVYNKEIDDQHKKLLSLGKQLQSFRNKGNKSKEEFLKIINELKEYTVYHFSSEEAIMEKGGYQGLEKHKEIHKNFVTQVTSIDFDNYDYVDKAELKKLIVFLSKWVLQHIRNEDFKYTSYVADQR